MSVWSDVIVEKRVSEGLGFGLRSQASSHNCGTYDKVLLTHLALVTICHTRKHPCLRPRSFRRAAGSTSTTSDGASPHCAGHSHRQRPGYDTSYPSFSSLYPGSGRQRVEFMTMAGARASLRCERVKEAPPDDARQPAIPLSGIIGFLSFVLSRWQQSLTY